MAKPIIAVDIDDVLSKTAEGFAAFSNQQWSTRLTPDDFQEDLTKFWGVTNEIAIERLQVFWDSDVTLHYELHDSAAEALKVLAESYRLIAVTSRSSVLVEKTKVWTERHFADVFDAVVHSGIYDNGDHERSVHRSKIDIYRQLQPDYVIDDHLKHCSAAAELGVPAVLFGNYPWNQTDILPTHVTRCNDWQAVLEYFDGRG